MPYHVVTLNTLNGEAQLVSPDLSLRGRGCSLTTYVPPCVLSLHKISNHADNLAHLDNTFNFPNFDAFNQPTFEALPPIQTPIYAASATSESPSSAIPHSATGTKRKADSISVSSPPKAIEDASRVAAEEDKRRRNTAASARFRVKKKQREQALEKSAKEMNDKVSALEGRINQLETENKWLKNLITEKNESKEDIAALWKKYNAEQAVERKNAERKDGVGTKAEA